MEELVSIIIPVYNQQEYIDECILSILNQTYTNLEIIIINDGSTDNSKEVIKKYALSDKRIVFIDKANTGVSDSRNIGIKKAKGKYLMFVDSDDWIEKNTVEDLKMIIEKFEVEIVKFNAIVYDSKGGKHLDQLYDLKNKKINIDNKNIVFNHLFQSKNNIACYTPTLFMKKDVVPFFNKNLKYMEDMAFYIDLLSKNNRIYFFDKHLYNYRYNTKSMTKYDEKQLDNIFEIIKSINYIKQHINKKYIEQLDCLAFTLSIGKIDLFLKSKKSFKYKKSRLVLLLKNKVYINVIAKTNFKNLTFSKKIEHFLLKNKMIFCFIVIQKIKSIIK